MQTRTAEKERRRGIVWLISGVLFLALMFGAWWLVATTNSEGHHDAQLLPFFALIPLSIGVYHLLRSRVLGNRPGIVSRSRSPAVPPRPADSAL